VFFCQLFNSVGADQFIQSLEKSVDHKSRDITKGVAWQRECKMLWQSDLQLRS
jgi:hypothetical protein